MTIELQFASLFSMLITGVYLGCMFDTNERISTYFKTNKRLSFVFQFVFWLVQSVLIFLFLVKINGGHVRVYFILAIVTGYWLYFLFIQKSYQVVLDKCLVLISHIFLLFKRLIELFMIKPIVFIVQAFLSLVNLAIMVIFKVIYFFLKSIEWLLKPIIKVIPENMKKYGVSVNKVYNKLLDKL